MPRKKSPPALVAAVVQPVARRLARLEDLLREVRHEQDVQLKQIARLQLQLDTLADQVLDERASRRQASR